MKTLSLALAGLLSAPAFAGPLIVADGPTGPVALFNPRPGDPGDVVVWDGVNWTARSAARIQHQASVEELACAITSGGALLCGYDLEDPSGIWRAIPAPGTTAFGPDTQLEMSGTGSDPFIDVLVPMAGGLAWGNWDSYYGTPYGATAWRPIFNPSTNDGLFLENSKLETSGAFACVVSHDDGEVGVWFHCDWNGTRRFFGASHGLFLETPDAIDLAGLQMTDDFVVATWTNQPGSLWYSAIAYDRNGDLWIAPEDVQWVAGTPDAAYYIDVTGTELHRWTLNSDDVVYTLPTGVTTYFAAHGDQVYAVGQDLGTGALGDLLPVH